MVMNEAEDALPPRVSIQVSGDRKSGAKYTNNILFQSVMRGLCEKIQDLALFTEGQETSLRRMFEP